MDNSNKNRSLFDNFPPTETSEWISVVKKDLKGKDFNRTLVWKTDEKIDLQPFYRKEDITRLEQLLKKKPGEFPYIRGNKKHDNWWHIDVDIRENDPETANSEAINAANNGVDSLTFEEKHFRSKESVEKLLKNIDLKKTFINVKVRDRINKVTQLISEYGENGNPNGDLRGYFAFDPLKEATLSGDSSEIDTYLSQLTNAVKESGKVFDNYRMLTVHSFPFKSSGGNIVQELAFTLSTAVEYLSRLLDFGLDTDSVCKRIVFSFSTGPSYFMEISKLRAARVLWSKIIEQHKPENEASYKMYIHARTASFNMTVYDPYVNMLRGTTETMAAAVGGADSITVDPFDSYYKEPDSFSKRVARNTQLIAREEAYLDKVIDPGAGSYYIEKITESICEQALNLFKKVEQNGGLMQSLENGFIQEEIKKSRSELEEKIYCRNKVFLGTNHYPNPDEKMLDTFKRAATKHERELTHAKERDFSPLKVFRGSEPFEKLRLNTEMHIKATGKTPMVFLLQLGDLRKRRARANFAYNFFGCAGFEIIDNSGFETVDIGVKTALQTNAQVVVICSSNEEYPDLVPEAVKRLRTKNPELLIVVAGYSETLEAELKETDFDDFIHTRTNVVEFLTKYQKNLGVLQT